MRPYSLLLLTFFQLVVSAPAPDITYTPTKEASCAMKWDIQTSSTTEHYEATGHCLFEDSADNQCSGGYRAPGFCPSEDQKVVDCCISRKCGQGEAGSCVNSDSPIIANSAERYYLFEDAACPSLGAPAACRIPTQSLPTTPGGKTPGGTSPGRTSPRLSQPEAQKPSQPMPNDLSSFNNNNNNLWTASASASALAFDVGDHVVEGEEGGGLLTLQQQEDFGFNLVNQQQQQQSQPATLDVGGGGGAAASTDGFTLFDNTQPLVAVSLGSNGDTRDDGTINLDGREVDALGANGSARDGIFHLQ